MMTRAPRRGRGRYTSPMSGRAARVAPRAGLGLSARDAEILTRARGQLPPGFTFVEAVAALLAAVEAVIPAGRLFELATGPRGPVVGSILSGVGMRGAACGVEIVRVVGADIVVLERWPR